MTYDTFKQGKEPKSQAGVPPSPSDLKLDDTE